MLFQGPPGGWGEPGEGPGREGHNRRVTFSVIQEIKIDGAVQFGAMSASIGSMSEPLLKQVVPPTLNTHLSTHNPQPPTLNPHTPTPNPQP